MPPKKPQKPKVKNTSYDGRSYTPLFEGLPDGMNLIDRAVYGEVVRRSGWADGKFTASAPTLGKMFGVNEKTIDRSFKKLEMWKVIVLVHRKNGEPTHYIPNKPTLWKIPEKKIIKRPRKQKETRDILSNTRDILSDTRDILSETRVKMSHKESRVESLLESKRGESTRDSKKKKDLVPVAPSRKQIPDAKQKSITGDYTKSYVPPIAQPFMK